MKTLVQIQDENFDRHEKLSSRDQVLSTINRAASVEALSYEEQQEIHIAFMNVWELV